MISGIIYDDSEDSVVVYENGIHLRGSDFVKGEFLPIASYWLDTIYRTWKLVHIRTAQE